MSTLLRQHAEQQFAEELHELKQNETNPVPENWEMSPQSVVTYLMGGKLKNGFEVSPKYIGNRRLMEIAVATLVTDRALLLYGLPGTAKSWVSEPIAAATSGDSTLIVQGFTAPIVFYRIKIFSIPSAHKYSFIFIKHS